MFMSTWAANILCDNNVKSLYRLNCSEPFFLELDKKQADNTRHKSIVQLKSLNKYQILQWKQIELIRYHSLISIVTLYDWMNEASKINNSRHLWECLEIKRVRAKLASSCVGLKWMEMFRLTFCTVVMIPLYVSLQTFLPIFEYWWVFIYYLKVSARLNIGIFRLEFVRYFYKLYFLSLNQFFLFLISMADRGQIKFYTIHR